MYKFLCHRLAGNRAISDHSYSSQQPTAVPVAQQTALTQQTPTVKLKPGQNVRVISSTSRVIGTAMVMEGNMLHRHEIPDSFVKICIHKIESKIPPLFTTTFDEPYLMAGVFTAWPAHQLQCVTSD